MIDFDWVLRPVDSSEAVRSLSQGLNNLPEALARALYLRGVRDFGEARLFFRGAADALHSPGSMADIDAAAHRVSQAIKQRERVVIYGDYDVDGTTATAMVTHFLREQGVPAAYFIPDRFKHGYGLCPAGIDEAIEMGGTLLIALDCGVTAVEEVAYARSRGLDVVICDHHTPPDVLPDATAVLDPKRSDCAYPFKELCGCGVAFKMLTRVLEVLGKDPATLEQYLDLVALATAADVVPLRGENRILLREGIKQLRGTPRLGITHLAGEARINLPECDARAIQFGIAPRINAAGRLGDAKRAVKLFLAHDETDAAQRAKQLEQVNLERRALDRKVLDVALEQATSQLENAGRRSVVLYESSWHLGVLGIVAARLVDKLHRPVVLLGHVNGVAKGSARSIPGVNVYDALSACQDLLITFGGHDYAAGMALNPSDLPAFQERFDQAVLDATTEGSFRRTLEIDAEVPVSSLNERFWAVLEQFGPFGAENAPPVFMSAGISVASAPSVVGRSGDHLRFRVREGDSPTVPVIGFGLAEKFDLVAAALQDRRTLDIAYSVTENRWNGIRSLQLQLKDLRAS